MKSPINQRSNRPVSHGGSLFVSIVVKVQMTWLAVLDQLVAAR
ncbi:hypothetical protein LRHMDP2_1993 [Lacticaseibacillus rhamnosus LRHMDP2]|uniref:Uncharacterized protein n=1 Tax=Lacticaseibacillus rhamnosus LRHMDP3 TaxID=1203259 RepID=A0AB33XST6_LACRH|nr:hypothetical protein LRHMDP3_2138 [Lacticaseibacillus rhamnosus LRHMDP3]EKS50450.1 hypothetical protein LRHMDP2_1993 [Lacticaseibacillus rhamnosus LRHMDP2]